jgi:hypothetical protein
MALSLCLYVTGIAITLKEFFAGERLKSSLLFCFSFASYAFLWSTLANGQLASVAVCSVGLAVSQEKRRRPFLSGLALSVLAYKPTLLLLLLPMLLLTRRFKTLAGFATGTAFLGIVTTMFAGRQIWVAYARFLNAFGHASGLYGHAQLLLWQFVDFNSLSLAIPRARSGVGLMLLIALSGVVGTCLARILWKSARSGQPQQYLAWAATLTWSMLLNVYYPIYDTILIAISIILSFAAARDLNRSDATNYLTALGLFVFASSWVTESIAQAHGIQLLSVSLFALGILQLLLLHDAIRYEEHGIISSPLNA